MITRTPGKRDLHHLVVFIGLIRQHLEIACGKAAGVESLERFPFLFLRRKEDGFGAWWEDPETGFGIEAAEGLGFANGEGAE